jgi:hypothetical protein
VWQLWASQWLHQLHQLSRPEAAIRLTETYLRCFYWWGVYLPFPFCAHLLDTWIQRAGGADTLVDALVLLGQVYPTGWDKANPELAPRWERVAAAVDTIRGEVAAALAEVDDPDSYCHIHALLEVISAHAAVYTTDFTTAIERCTHALSLLPEGEEWLLAWLRFELADILRAYGDHVAADPRNDRETTDRCYAAARDHCAEVMRRVEEGVGDAELRANVARLEADILWEEARDGDRTPNDEFLVRCVFERLCVAVIGSLEDVLHYGLDDAYVRSFYREMTERAAGRLCKLAEFTPANNDLVADILAALADVWPEAAGAGELTRSRDVRRRGRLAIADMLFPTLPDADPARADENRQQIADWIAKARGSAALSS